MSQPTIVIISPKTTEITLDNFVRKKTARAHLRHLYEKKKLLSEK